MLHLQLHNLGYYFQHKEIDRFQQFLNPLQIKITLKTGKVNITAFVETASFYMYLNKNTVNFQVTK